MAPKKRGRIIVGVPEESDFSSKPVKDTAYLFGPFVGELSWEIYRFAPHVIYSAKRNPKVVIVVFTRPERFDIYGSYADILVPLKVEESKQECFKSSGIPLWEYNWIAERLKLKYLKKFNIAFHQYPNISGEQYRLKWQFSRSKMSYEFKPRVENDIVVDELMRGLRKKIIVVDLSWVKETETKKEILDKLTNLLEKRMFVVYDEDLSYLGKYAGLFLTAESFPLDGARVTLLGCMISLLRRSFVTVGNLSSPISHLSLLLKTPLLTLQEKTDSDGIHLLNPLETQVTKIRDIDNLVKRLEKI